MIDVLFVMERQDIDITIVNNIRLKWESKP